MDNAAPWTPTELLNCTVAPPKIIDIDGGRETVIIKTDNEGREVVAYFWVAPGEAFHCKMQSVAVCRNMRRGWFGHGDYRRVMPRVLIDEENGVKPEVRRIRRGV